MKNHHSQAQLHCLRLLLLSCFHAAFFLASAMTAAPAPSLAVADNFLAALPSMISFKTSSQRLVPFRSKPIGLLRLSCSSALHSLTPFNLSLSKKKFPFVVSLVSRTSDWALRDEDYEEDEEDNALESGVRNGESEWEGDTDEFELSEGDGPEADLSEWEGDNSEDMDDSIEALARKLDLSEGEGPEADLSEWEGENLEEEKNAVQALAQELELPDGKEQEASLSGWKGDNRERKANVGEAVTKGDSPVNEGISDELRGDSFPEPPEDAKLFVGNLPYDVDSEKLAHLFEKAGIVEVAEVIYSRETGQSRGFGFVSMSTVEEAERAVEMLNRYECEGRLLTVNKASPRGSLPERTRELEPSFRIYAGNLPWQVDDSRLEKVFGRYGQVVNARVVYDRETGRSRGFGFVTMASKDEQEEAIEALDGQTMDGRAIRVNAAEERPRRASF